MTTVHEQPSTEKAAAPGPSREARYRISMDLGSDSTVVYVKVPNDPEPKRINLQYFARALQGEPFLLADSDGSISHRLRSRYAIDSSYKSDGPLTSRLQPWGQEEILPADHATKALLDFSSFLAEPSVSEGNLTHHRRNENQVLFKFIDDNGFPFPFEDLLPNTKLVFTSGIQPREFVSRYLLSDNAEKVERHRLQPLEMIKNQICLILENFVRHHPLLASDGPPDWSECSIVLTVPNTYSPIHRELLAKAVASTLNCPVNTITESDAIVFHYIRDQQPNRGMSLEQLSGTAQQYLTIDVGKGTTDLTLMLITNRKREPADTTTRPHVFVQARTGRASGGAKVTFMIASFLERLIDIAVQSVARSRGNGSVLDQELRTSGSPIRLTTQNSSELKGAVTLSSGRNSRYRDLLLAFESVCEEHKRELELKGTQKKRVVHLPPLGDSANADAVAEHIAAMIVRLLESRVVIDEPTDDEESGVVGAAAATEDPRTQTLQGLIEGIRMALANPEQMRASATGQPQAEAIEEAWSILLQNVQAYVDENVDKVLIELAVAHYAGNQKTAIKDPEDALGWIADLDGLQSRQELPHGMAIRTRVIIAGQASQFKPLRMRLLDVCRKAGLEVLGSQQVSTRGSTGMNKAVAMLMGLVRKLVPAADTGYDPTADGVEVLKRGKLKDGCAHGALAWYLESPVMENPDHIHGQLAVSLQGGGEEVWVPMDKLNAEKEFTHNSKHNGARIVYYFPSRGERDKTPHDLKAAPMGDLMSCDSFTIELQSMAGNSGQIVVRGGGSEMRLKNGLYEAAELEHLRAMLWPTELHD